jgi:hypothetical protein
MGLSKFFRLGVLPKGATSFKDYTPLASAPPRPRPGVFRTWLDSLGMLNLFTSTGPAVKAIIGSQEEYNDAIALKHSNTADHIHTNKEALDAYTGESSGQDLSAFAKAVQGSLSNNSHAGNSRGLNATDFQFARESADRVASGEGSFIAGGQHNRVSGANSMVAAGSHNEVSGQYCLVGGEHNEVSSTHSAAFGDLHVVSGEKSAAFGSGHQVSGGFSSAMGDGNAVSGLASHAEGSMNECIGNYSHAEGMNARAYNHFQHAKSSGGFNNPGEIGEAQYTNLLARAATFDDSPTDLIVGEEGTILLEPDKMNAFHIRLVASSDDRSEGSFYEFKGLVRRNTSALSTTILGSVNKSVISESVPAWDASVSADTVTGSLKITVTGEADKSIRWVAYIEMIEVAFYGA